MEPVKKKAPRLAAAPQAPRLAYEALVSILPGVVFLTGLMGISNFYAARQKILSGVQNDVQILAGQAAENLSDFFRQRREDARGVAEAPLLGDYLKNVDYGLLQEADTYRAELARYFASYANRVGVYSRIAYYDESGRELAAGSLAGPARKLSKTPTAVPPGLEPGKVLDTGISAQAPGSLAYWSGVFDEQGRPRGSIALTCDLSRVREMLERVRVGKKGRAFLADGQGRELLTTSPPLLNAIMARAQIVGTPWKIRIEADSSEFLKPLRWVLEWMSFLAVLGAVLLTLWVLYNVRKIAQPIEDMAEGTKRIAAGDLDFRFDMPAVHELQTLGQAFNEMAKSLKQRNADLEARIRELTTLREMEQMAIEHFDEETVLRACLMAISDGLAFDRVGLYWVDQTSSSIAGRFLYTAQASIPSETEFRGRRVPLGESDILNEALKSRAAALIHAPEQDSRVLPFMTAKSKTREFVAAPICGKNRVYGVFTADTYLSRRPLSETDKEGLTLFANAVGLALENTTLLRTLAESEARYRTVLENSPVAIVGLSRYQRIATWNRGAESIFGFDAPEIVGKPVTALFPPGGEPEFQRLLNRLMEEGSVRDHAMPGQAKGGRRLDLSISWGGTHKDFWMNQEWTVVIRDVTEAKKLQERLIQSEKLSAIGRLISGIAHELNNPLQAVVGYAQLLAFEKEPASLQEDLRFIFDNAVRCRKIIDNLLLSVRQGKVSKEPVEIETAVQAALDLLSYKLQKTAGVEVRLHLPESLPRVMADFQQLQQIFVNLMSNASDAMAGMRGPKRIDIRAKAADGRVIIEIADNGPGIPEEVSQRIFEPFFTTKGAGRGTGLGLSICRQIAEEHGGRIDFTSRLGSGTTFHIELPVAPKGGARLPKKESSLPAPEAGKTVLLIDDEPAVCALLRKALESDGLGVTTAPSLEDALLKAQAVPFDLVVADVQLGGRSGLDLYDDWPQVSARPRPPFLFMTGDILNEELEAALKAIGLPVLYKPVDLTLFAQAVRAILAQKERRS